ncbi:MAG TPA: helix-turn-helix domain-containing protein [Pyrinomonadaceae bacterium]|nr:helix-turn-helix domain-containing protein [Pyrinomonadaceae bacterium]
MRRRKIDGCPIAGALQMMGDKWTLLVVRDLAGGPKRTMELHTGLFPISSRTLVARLRDMEKDKLVERIDFGGNPPHIEYRLTERGRILLPLVDALRGVGQSLDCSNCEERKKQLGFYCEACPNNSEPLRFERYELDQPAPRPPARPRQKDDSIVLL